MTRGRKGWATYYFVEYKLENTKQKMLFMMLSYAVF